MKPEQNKALDIADKIYFNNLSLIQSAKAIENYTTQQKIELLQELIKANEVRMYVAICTDYQDGFNTGVGETLNTLNSELSKLKGE